MEPLSSLLFLLEPCSLALILTAVLVVLAAAHRALAHERESEKHRDVMESSITLDGRQAVMVPVVSSVSLLLMFYVFASISQVVTAFTALASVSAVAFALSPIASRIASVLGAPDSAASRNFCWSMGRSQALLTLVSVALVLTWLVTGHWVLNNLLGMAICVAFVSHVRLPNVKVCALLLTCLFFYDIFWVFFSERIFGANVMVTVATQQAMNPVHTVAQSLHLPVSDTITTHLDLPVKLLFPRDLLRRHVAASGGARGGGMDYMMLGLGDMAIPGMLLALVLGFEHRKGKDPTQELSSDGAHRPSRGYRYLWYATAGYALGLVAALGVGLLTRAPQPALLYLVPSTLGPVAGLAWLRRELGELWNGVPRKQCLTEKEKGLMDV